MTESHLDRGAEEIVSLLDAGALDEVRTRLMSDYLNMRSGDFDKLVRKVNHKESKSHALDLKLTDRDKDGNLEVEITKPGSYLGERSRGVGILGNAETIVGTFNENNSSTRVAREHRRVEREEMTGKVNRYIEQRGR